MIRTRTPREIMDRSAPMTEKERAEWEIMHADNVAMLAECQRQDRWITHKEWVRIKTERNP